ncbi:MAG: ribose 5-phosphate isomerase B [Clostridia bacterium]|nr:ribose 5-phosphate isomerase B [Clostridia bacterium]MEE1277615.1 ribose 5-phosphate isomerase B [Acutalibacteraceae bacterium]
MIAIGCDHGGLNVKNALCEHLKDRGLEVCDFGTFDTASVDYPDIAKKVCTAVQKGEAEKGILVCGTGIGMSIAANKHKGIRAAVCSEHFSTRYTRLHNDSNVLCLGERVIGAGLACELADLFIDTAFEGGRHMTRVNKITEIENGGC